MKRRTFLFASFLLTTLVLLAIPGCRQQQQVVLGPEQDYPPMASKSWSAGGTTIEGQIDRTAGGPVIVLTAADVSQIASLEIRLDPPSGEPGEWAPITGALVDGKTRYETLYSGGEGTAINLRYAPVTAEGQEPAEPVEMGVWLPTLEKVPMKPAPVEQPEEY